MQHNHICGLYFVQGQERIYLPQIKLKSHTTLTPVYFTTKLTQKYDNPNDATLAQVRFTFPLYDGVAVNGYSISFADKTLHGVVQQKHEAKKTYQAAVDRGETAGLLESLPAGVFGVTLGNVPANTGITVEITYCGELKHDAGVDGLRYTLPTSIAPRYGKYPGKVLSSNTTNAGGISITVDADMAGSAIRKIQSPSHPIAVSMGALSTTAADNKAPFATSQASATLTAGNTELADDFILQVLVDDIERPQAILETHPTLQNQRALMTTLVPKFALESANPEIVFIADQSGSMGGTKNAALVKALKVFLKSLPFGVRFNICAFGNSFQFLFPTSQAYNEDNLGTALSFVESFKANYGGTEILKPITAAFHQHIKDLSLEVMLLTDGEIWAENAVFKYINEQITEKKVDARVFALGIGSDVSHTLVEGVARAGNGFAQFVTQDEETDQKVMRMLRAALYAHTKDYELEVYYDDKDSEHMRDDDDFEIVEKVNDCLKIAEHPATIVAPPNSDTSSRKPQSFFDTSARFDGLPAAKSSNPSDERYAHLPAIDTPKLLQAPTAIPPLFPFNRTTLYLLLGPETPQMKVTSIMLRATSAQGPLELNIPVHATASTDGVPTIHQLAARKATQEIEQGRGWLYSATAGGAEDILAKDKFQARFDELVERECVRLGEKFQVAGKWTSFVAVEANGEKVDDLPEVMEARQAATRGFAARMPAPRKQLASMAARRYVDADIIRDGDRTRRAAVRPPLFGSVNAAGLPQSRGLFGSAAGTPQGGGLSRMSSSSATGGELFGSAPLPAQGGSGGLFGNAPSATRGGDLLGNQPPAASAGGLFGSGSSSTPHGGGFGGGLFGRPSSSTAHSGGLFGSAQSQETPLLTTNSYRSAPSSGPVVPPPPARTSRTSGFCSVPARKATEEAEEEESDEDMGYGLFDDDTSGPVAQAVALQAPASQPSQAMQAQYAREMQAAACMPLADEDDDDDDDDMPLMSKKKSVKSAGATSAEDARKMSALIDLQTFSGAWGWKGELFALLGVNEGALKAALGTADGSGDDGFDETTMATALAVAFLEARVQGKKEVWEMVGAKARAFLKTAMAGDGAKVEEVLGKAKLLF